MEETPSAIPACVTDEFMGAVIWLQFPQKAFEINKKKIIADAFAAMQPSDELRRKYVLAISELKEKGKINDDRYFLLKCDSTAMNMLQEMTLGDPDRFNVKIAKEIAEKITQQAKEEGRKEMEGKYIEAKAEVSDIKVNIEQWAEKQAKIRGWLVSGVLFIIAALIFFPPIVFEIIGRYQEIKIGCWALGALIALASLLGLTIPKIRKWVQGRFKKRIIKTLVERKEPTPPQSP